MYRQRACAWACFGQMWIWGLGTIVIQKHSVLAQELAERVLGICLRTCGWPFGVRLDELQGVNIPILRLATVNRVTSTRHIVEQTASLQPRSVTWPLKGCQYQCTFHMLQTNTLQTIAFPNVLVPLLYC